MKNLFYLFLLCCSLSFGQDNEIDSLKNIIKNENSKEVKLNTLELLNRKLISEHLLEKSLPFFIEMGVLAKEMNKDEIEAKAYRYISETYMKKRDSAKSIDFAYKALEIDKRNKNLNNYLLDINQLGRVYYRFEKYKEAIRIYNIGIRKYNKDKTSESLDIMSNIYLNLSNAHGKNGQQEKSINAILKGVKIAEKSNNSEGKSYGLYVMGYKYMELKNYEKAEKYFLESLSYSDSVSLKTYVNMNHHGLGINYSRWKKYDKALYHNNKALDFYRKQNNKIFEFDILNNTAVVYQKMKKPDSIIKYATLALKIAEDINHKLAINGANLTLSEAHLILKQYKKAEKILLEVVKDTINNKLISKEIKASIFSNLSDVYEGLGNYKKGLKYHKRFKALNDSLNTEINKSSFTEIETKYQTEQKEKENLQLIADKAEQELAIQQASTRNRFLIFGLIILFIILFFIWRRYKTERKARQVITSQKNEIEQQKKKVEMLQKELHHRMKNNLSFIDLFINLAKGRFTDAAYQDKLNELQNRMRSMFEVHKQLFKKEDVTAVKAKSYIDVLVKNVKQAYDDKHVSIINNTHKDETLLANTSFPVGLIVNEFVTNSYKYAFQDTKDAVINISLTSDDEEYQLSLTDNGKGLPDDFNIDNLDSFGLETIQLLTQEYKGTFQLDGSEGVSMYINLPKTAA